MSNKVIKFGKSGQPYKIECVDGKERTVFINTADYNLVSRAEAEIAKLNDLKEEYGKETNDTLKETLPKFDKMTREIINNIFATDVCTPAFGQVNCWSLTVDEGLPLWIGFLDALLTAVKSDMDERTNKLKKNIGKYIKE